MTKKALLIFVGVFAAVQCGVISDPVHRRVARSPCPACDRLPPPPLLSTQNWSGLARTADGFQNAVFSGAAAAAEPGVQSAGEAFSLASSAVNNPRASLTIDQTHGYTRSGPTIGVKGGLSPTINDFQSTASGNRNHKLSSENYKQQEPETSNYGNQRDFGNLAYNQKAGYDTGVSLSQSATLGNHKEDNNERDSQTGRGDTGSVKSASNFENSIPLYHQSEFRAHNENSDHLNSNGPINDSSLNDPNGNKKLNSDSRRSLPGEPQDQQGFGSSQSTQHGPFGSNYGNFGKVSSQPGHNGRDNFEGVNGYHNTNAQESVPFGSKPQLTNAGPGQKELHTNNIATNHNSIGRGADESELQNANESHQHNSYGSNFNDVGSSSSQDAAGALKGALDLTSQGLQAARQAPCSTCGKGSYAYSKAKSYSGAAIALSIGG